MKALFDLLKAGIEHFTGNVFERAAREKARVTALKPLKALKIHVLEAEQALFIADCWRVSCRECDCVKIVPKKNKVTMCDCGAVFDTERWLAFNRKPTSEEMERIDKK